MAKKKIEYAYLQIVFCDHEQNGFLTFGGAEFPTVEKNREEFRRIPAAPAETDFVLDLFEEPLGNTKNKFITQETAEGLMGKPFGLEAERKKCAEYWSKVLGQKIEY